MNKLIILAAVLLLPVNCLAQNTPCSGKNSGISHCDGSQFICSDGSVSKSQKNCMAEFGVIATDNATPISLPAAITQRSGNILKLDYEGFTVWVDCAQRGAVKFQYVAQHDTGNEKRAASFELDPNVPKECQQFTSKTYGNQYDRGHQVPANHLDASPVAIKQSNFMTNVLPQAANMNRGAWLQTEEIVECYRDISELLVIGGTIFGNNPDDDYFLQSHGVVTPDAFYKVIVRGTGQDERAIAWIVPNSQDATRKNLDKYLVTIDEIERVTGEKIPVADYAKHDKPSSSWLIPRWCNKG